VLEIIQWEVLPLRQNLLRPTKTMDNKVMVRLLLAFAVLLSTNVLAADWELFDKSNSVSSYLDLDSLMLEETKYTVWLKSVYAKPQKLRQDPGGAYFQKLELMHVECSRRSYFIEKSIYTSKEGTPLATRTTETGPETVTPDSPSEVRYIAICKKPGRAFRAMRNQGIRYQPLEEEAKPWWKRPLID
jgi:hypothetical protein